MPYPNNPNLQQMLMQIDQESAQKKANLMQSFYAQQNAQNTWNPTTPTPAPASTPVQNVQWIPVNGLQGAKEHQVPANATHWLMDSNDSVFYVKAADEFGVSKQFKAYRFEEVEIAPAVEAPQAQIDTSKFISRDEFDELKAKIDQLATAPVPVQKKPAGKAKDVKEESDNG